jgi:excisionase family DNA binding protein
MIDRSALEAMLTGAEPGELLSVGTELQARALAALVRPKSAPADDRLLDMEEVARVLGVPEGQARDLGRRGELPTVLVGRYVRVRASTLRDWMDAREGGRLRLRRRA